MQALENSVRVQILEMLLTETRTIPEMARILGIHRVSLHHHMNILRAEGLIEEVAPAPERRIGRPAQRFRALKGIVTHGYPPRRFEMIGEIALRILSEKLGEHGAVHELRQQGIKNGQTAIEGIESQKRPGVWTPEDFEHIVVDGLFPRFGSVAKVVERSPKHLKYRVFNCPFLELAETLPSLVCNALDQGFHEGFDKALKGVKTERLSCMGHGDPYCEYRMTWRRRSRAPARSRRKVSDLSCESSGKRQRSGGG